MPKIIDLSTLEEMESPVIKHRKLLRNIKNDLPNLENKLNKYSDHWHCEDPFYRFYYGSFKVSHARRYTEDIVKTLRVLSPLKDKKLSSLFEEIIMKQEVESNNNEGWFERASPVINAFMHSRYFLELAVKYGKELEKAPAMMPSGWAALLCLYRVR